MTHLQNEPLGSGNRQLVRFLGIVPNDPACQGNDDQEKKPGDSDINMPEWTGGDGLISHPMLRGLMPVGHSSPLLLRNESQKFRWRRTKSALDFPFSGR
jgi:hypothetical protein